MKTMTYNELQTQSKVRKGSIGFATVTIVMAFLALLFTGSNLRIGGIMLRYIFALLLLADAMFLMLKIFFDKTLVLFLAFIVFLGLSCFATGHISEFISQLYYSYFLALLSSVFVMALLRRDPSFVKYITYLILAIGAFDVIVTYSQFVFNDDWYRPIEEMFKLPVWEAYEDLGYKFSSIEVMDSTLPGILGNGVYNGYFLSVCAVLSMVFVIRTKKSLLYVIPFFFILGGFFCQQRAPLFISIFVIGMISLRLLKEFSNFSRVILFIFLSLAAMIAISILSDFSELFNLRYSSTGLDSTGRTTISANALDYIMDHPIIANFYELVELKGHAPHNLFLNAYVYGGIFSFIIIMYILYLQTKTFLVIVRNEVAGVNAYYYVFAWSWAAFTLNGLAHNRSIITGDYMVWMIWGVMAAAPTLYVKHQTKKG